MDFIRTWILNLETEHYPNSFFFINNQYKKIH